MLCFTMNNSRFVLYIVTVSIIWGGLLYLSISMPRNGSVWTWGAFAALFLSSDLPDMLYETEKEKIDKRRIFNDLSFSIHVLTVLAVIFPILYFDYEGKLLSNNYFMSLVHAGIGAIWASKIQYVWYFKKICR